MDKLILIRINALLYFLSENLVNQNIYKRESKKNLGKLVPPIIVPKQPIAAIWSRSSYFKILGKWSQNLNY